MNVSELIRPQLPKPPNIPPALPDRPPMPIEMTHGLSNTSNANDQASSAIYEEIQDDIVSTSASLLLLNYLVKKYGLSELQQYFLSIYF